MRVLPTRWRRKPAGIDMNRNYVTVTLCIRRECACSHSRTCLDYYGAVILRRCNGSCLRTVAVCAALVRAAAACNCRLYAAVLLYVRSLHRPQSTQPSQLHPCTRLPLIVASSSSSSSGGGSGFSSWALRCISQSASIGGTDTDRGGQARHLG